MHQEPGVADMKKDLNKVMIKRMAKSTYIDSDQVLPLKTRRIECAVTEATFGKVSYMQPTRVSSNI